MLMNSQNDFSCIYECGHVAAHIPLEKSVCTQITGIRLGHTGYNRVIKAS